MLRGLLQRLNNMDYGVSIGLRPLPVAIPYPDLLRSFRFHSGLYKPVKTPHMSAEHIAVESALGQSGLSAQFAHGAIDTLGAARNTNGDIAIHGQYALEGRKEADRVVLVLASAEQPVFVFHARMGFQDGAYLAYVDAAQFAAGVHKPLSNSESESEVIPFIENCTQGLSRIERGLPLVMRAPR